MQCYARLPYGARHELDGQPQRGEEGGEHRGGLRGELLAGQRETCATASADASLEQAWEFAQLKSDSFLFYVVMKIRVLLVFKSNFLE